MEPCETTQSDAPRASCEDALPIIVDEGNLPCTSTPWEDLGYSRPTFSSCGLRSSYFDWWVYQLIREQMIAHYASCLPEVRRG